MIAKNRFDQNPSHPTNELAVILKRAPTKKVNLILSKQLKPSFRLQENVMTCCEFNVEETGYYHVSSQVTIKNDSKETVHVEYLQFGICNENMENYKENLKSMIMNSNCASEYVMVDNMTAIVNLEKDIKYVLWVNFGCDKSESFVFDSECSNLRLYKL